MNLSDSPRLRIFTLCALYVAQGIPFGFVAYTLAAYLADRGLGVEPIGRVLALSTLPWAFKWAWGPVIDRFGLPSMGRRRPWILLAEALMALTIAALIAIPDLTAGVAALGWMVLLHNVFNSLQDVAVDALAVDLLQERERGRANGLMFGSKYLGTFIGGAGMNRILGAYGLRAALILQVAMLLAIMVLPLCLRERAGERLLPRRRGRRAAPPGTRPTRTMRGVLLNLARAFSLRSTLTGALLAVAVQIAMGVLAAVAPVLFMQTLGWTRQNYVDVTGGAGVALGLAGSVAGGFLADRVGHRRLAGIACALLGLVWIAFGLARPLWSHATFVKCCILLDATLASVLAVSLFALFMDISWPRVAATQFTAYMALLNLSTAIGSGLAGTIEGRLPYAGIYLCAGVFQMAVILLLRFIDPRQTRRVLGEDAD